METLLSLIIVILLTTALVIVYFMYLGKKDQLEDEEDSNKELLERVIQAEADNLFLREVIKDAAKRPVIAALSEQQAVQLGETIGAYILASRKGMN